MPSDTTERAMGAEEMQALRDRVNALIGPTCEIKTKADAAREADIPYQTLAAWLGNSYAGNNANIAEKVAAWLATRDTRRVTLAAAPQAPRFVQTETATAIMSALAHAQHMPDFVIITGAAGVGKTEAACRFTRENRNVVKIVAGPSLRSPAALLDELCFALGINQGGRLHMKLRALIARVRDKGTLIIVDEANFLSTEALEQLRAVHDQANIGIALVGNPAVFGRLSAEGNEGQNAQISRRVGLRLKRPKSLRADMDALIDAWGITGEAERKLLRAIASKPGALGRMTKTLRIAHMVAAQQRMAVSADLIRQAFEQLDGTLSAGEAA